MRRGLFLDLDGTLADSIVSLRSVYDSFLRQHDRQGSDAEFNSLNGPSLPEIVSILKDRHRLGDDRSRLQDEYLALLDTHHEDAPPNPGARQLVDHAREAGWQVCIVTSSSRSLLDTWLARHDFTDAIEFTVCGDETHATKPDPEPYLHALGLTGCVAEHSMAIEDSGNGVLSATRAGLRTWRLCPTGPLPEGPEVGQLATLSEAERLLRP